MNKFKQNGVYTITSYYGDSYSYLFKDDIFTSFNDKQKLNRDYVDKEINCGMITVTFVDTLDNFQ